ncbi:MAG: O-antigen ligase family protein [Candidatus Methylumidiphilus sp.]
MEKAVNGSSVSESGEQIVTARMVGSGLFGDPNDMCMVIVTGLILGIYWMGDNLLYAVSLPIFGYGLMQTQSRGGFIAFMAACGVLLLTRYGWKKGAMLLAAGLPVLLLVFKGRMTKISTDEGTAHSRIELWGDGLEFFKSSPLFGVGAGKFHELTDDGHVAHNAYVQAYAELGLFGGIFFIGAFYFSLSAIYGMAGTHTEGIDPNIRRAQSIMMALTAGIATLLLTLSQTFYMTTYMIFGLITAYLRITNASKILIGFRVDSSFIKRLLLAGILFLAVLFLFVRFFK